MYPGSPRTSSWAPRISSRYAHSDDDQEPNEGLGVWSYGEEDEQGDVLRVINTRPSSYYFDRQMYLHSYQFSRNLTVCDKLKGSMRKLQAAALSVIYKTSSSSTAASSSSVSKFRRTKNKIKRLISSAPFLCSVPRCIH